MKHKLTISTLLLVGLFLTLAPIAFASTTWYVDGVYGNDANACKSPKTAACQTIGHAIALASSGDSIRVAPATYSENLIIGISLKIIGSGASATIIDGRREWTVVSIATASALVSLSNVTVQNGSAPFGGGIGNVGTLTLTNSTVSGNLAPNPCIPFGLVCLWAGTAGGGGIYNSGALIISNSIISGNQAGRFCTFGSIGRPCGAFGGGIYNKGTLVMISNSTLTGNSVGTGCIIGPRCFGAVAGGAIYSLVGTVTLNNSTITGSVNGCSGVCPAERGGAIVSDSGNLALNNSTVSGNPAGGIINNGTTTLQNSILANNSGKNCVGAITSHGYNLSTDGTCKLYFHNSGDRNNIIDPKLGALGNWGGPTPTIPLLSGSPAIDAGNPSGCRDSKGNLLKTDQRGMPRPDSEDKLGCDMGAYETQSD